LYYPAVPVHKIKRNGVTHQDKKLIREVTKIIKKKSLFADSLDWKQIGRQVNTLPFGADEGKNHRMIFDFFTKKLRSAGDKHSFFMAEKSISAYKKEHKMALPKGTYLGNGIGMIKVPGCFLVDKGQYVDFANDIRHQIEKTDTGHAVNGWIVDLRGNTGGNMWPMLAGLNALTEDGTAGYFVSNGGRIPWRVSNGKLSSPPAEIDAYKIKDLHVKIAVLIDSLTASSGEMTAIAFMGLPNVKVFGRPSAGYTTANYSYHLSDGSMLNLAQMYVADRTFKAYTEKIIPDVPVDDKKGSADKTLKAAEKWLLQADLPAK
jgi:C-terminal processing protease CtpA/Prc